MSIFGKHLKFYLTGGLPNTSRYERRKDLLQQKYERYEFLRRSEAVTSYRDLAAQLSVSRNQSGLTRKEWRELKQKFKTLRKSDEIIEFFKLQKKTGNFKGLAEWQEVFSGAFNTQTLDESKWLPRPSLIGLLPGLLYSSADDNHVFTDGENMNFTGKSVQLITRKESGTGLMYSQEFGFFPTERNYTSAIINTGDTHKQQYGKIEAKIKIDSFSKYVYHGVWMSAGKRLPHINLFRLGEKLEFSVFAENEQNERVQHVDLWCKNLIRKNAYYILKLEWDKDFLHWYINGKKMFSAQNIVDEPLYIAFSSGVIGEPHKLAPSVMEIEWVKAYSLREK